MDLQEIRQKYPQYQDMSDQDLADHFHDKFYSDMPREQFNQKLGLAPPKTRTQAAGEMFTDIPQEIKNEVNAALEGIQGFGEWAKGEGAQEATPESVGRGLMKGAGALGSAAYLGTGIGPAAVGAAKSVIGHGYEALVGGDEGTYEDVKKGVDIGGAVYGGGQALKHGARTLRDWWKGGALPTQTAAGEASMARAGGIARDFDPASEMRDPATGKPIQGQMLAGSAEEGGALMQHGLRRAAEMEQEEIGNQFKVSTGDFGKDAKPAAINTEVAMQMPQQLVKDLQMNRVSLAGNPQASAIMKNINTEINGLAARNQGAPMWVTNLNLSAVDQIKLDMSRRRMLAASSGNQEDVKAVHTIMESFDRQVDGWVNSNKFQGDKKAVKAWNVARQRENLYRKNFTSMGREPLGTVVERIIGENKHGPQTGREVADYATGSMGINPSKYNAKVITGIRDILGERSPEWAGARQGTWMNIVQPNQQAWKPREIKTNILEFLDGKGREVANVMFSPQERQTMREFAQLQGHLDIAKLPQGTTASQIPQRIAMGVASLFMGHLDSPTKMVHQGVSVAMSKIIQGRELRDLNNKISSVRGHVATWWKKVNPTGKDPTSREQRMKTYAATVALTDSLKRLGIGGIDQRPQPGMAEQETKRDKLSFGGPTM